MDRVTVRKESYFDSVFLMAASAELARVEGLEAGQLVLATAHNRALLAAQGFALPDGEALGPTDLVIALRGRYSGVLDVAAARVEVLLAARGRAQAASGAAERARGLDGGLAQLPDANLALISVPGEYAAYEAQKALAQGLHVMLFSNNVPLEEEVALKRRAAELGLLVMGPDCGTALVQGKPLGFANRVRSGAIGLVGASGTGLQEVACQIHRLGSGVSHILGTGGRDLSAAVGGASMLAALELLARDPETRVLGVVSKPPAAAVAERVLRHLEGLGRPAVVCFLGERDLRRSQVLHARDLSEAAWIAHCLATGRPTHATQPFDMLEVDDARLLGRMSREQRFVLGLFTGGTLATEALLVLRDTVGQVFSNLSPPEPGPPGHCVLDLGDDEFTRGRPHPMIDPTPRNQRIVETGSGPDVAVLLLDFVLGHGAHADPAGAAVEAIRAARARNPGLAVLASITGTDLDPQGLARQKGILAEAGVTLLPSNAAAAYVAARIVRGLEEVR